MIAMIPLDGDDGNMERIEVIGTTGRRNNLLALNIVTKAPNQTINAEQARALGSILTSWANAPEAGKP